MEMVHTLTRSVLLAACFMGCLLFVTMNDAEADPYGRYNMQCGYNVQQQGLFYNYYIGGGCGGIPAQLYLSPRPTPPLVGHTYVTYQPFLPHEMLYKHHRTYYRIHPDGSGVRTKIRWY